MSERIFHVTIEETLCKSVAVKAENEYDACQIVRKNWLNKDYILSADDFATVEFYVTNQSTGATTLNMIGGECFENLGLEIVQSEVLNVEWYVQPDGCVISQVNFRPIEFEDEIVRYCDGYNAKYIEQTKLGKGSIVEIAKQNNCAPFIYRVVAISGNYDVPDFCPNCHSELKWYGVNLCCVNPHCREFEESEEEEIL